MSGAPLFSPLLRLASSPRRHELRPSFGGGIPATRWEVFRSDASDAPWNIAAPDSSGALRISKSQDQEPWLSGKSPHAGARSLFTFDGDFFAFVDFELLAFPLAGSHGAIDALISVSNGTAAFSSLRMSTTLDQRAEAFMSLSPQTVASVGDATV